MKTILLADDNPILIQVYKPALLQAGFRVKVAEDGLATARMLASTKPDLLILDLMMPKLTGTDVMKYIRSTPDIKSMPVIILSDASIADLAQEAIKIGVEKVFLKSQCTPAIMIDAIKELLGNDAASPASLVQDFIPPQMT